MDIDALKEDLKEEKLKRTNAQTRYTHSVYLSIDLRMHEVQRRCFDTRRRGFEREEVQNVFPFFGDERRPICRYQPLVPLTRTYRGSVPHGSVGCSTARPGSEPAPTDIRTQS
eukprot:GHVU01229955.1.p2 GENE.GHVU01229955.1~~GHVU01229955.1.p2  ORF type:complete len:113 (-),score=12.04 GHVU01229955.1:68-406(-)